MSQAEVLEFLSDNKGIKFTSKQIAEKLVKNHGNVGTNLSKLLKHNLVKTNKLQTDYKKNYRYWVD